MIGSMRIAHISDLHFAVPTFSPLQFFSKRWIGNFYQLFSRKNELDPKQLCEMPDLFAALNVDTVLITGDLTTTAQIREYQLASEFIETLKERNLRVVVIPGNHDHYTKRSWRNKDFYRFFSDYSENGFSLKDDGVAIIPLDQSWTLIALDTAVATSLRSSNGHFTQGAEAALRKALKKVSLGENVIVMNHFPLFENDKASKNLVRAAELRTLLSSHPNVRFYIHGHTHIHCVADLRPSRLPIILDSGSASHLLKKSWNLIDISSSGATVHAYSSAAEPVLHNFQWSSHERTSLV